MKVGNYLEILKKGGVVLIGVAIIITVISLFQSYSIVHPLRRPVTLTPSYYGMDYESVVFNSSDGLRLKGWLILNNESRSMVIVSHGHGANKGDVLEVAGVLYRNGYSTFLFDFRAHGESEGDFASLGWLETNDLEGAIEFVKDRANPDNIGVIGFSMGGTVAITTAGQRSDIKAVVADSAFADRSKLIDMAVKHVLPSPLDFLIHFFLRMQGMDMVENLPLEHVDAISPNALLIIQGDKDHLVEVEDAMSLYDKAKEPKELWLVPGAPHVGAHQTEKSEYEKRILEFFDKYLKGG